MTDDPARGELTDYQRGYLAGFDAPANVAARTARPSELLREAIPRLSPDAFHGHHPGCGWTIEADPRACDCYLALAADDPGLDVVTTCLDYAAHRWNSNGSPSFCGDCGIEFPMLSARAERRAARLTGKEGA